MQQINCQAVTLAANKKNKLYNISVKRTESLFIILYSLLAFATADAQEAETYVRTDAVRTFSSLVVEPHPQAWHLDTFRLWKDYRAAVKDASVAEAAEISRTLPAITRPGDHPLMEWTDDNGCDMVLVASMTNAEEADKWREDSTFLFGNSLSWVTLPYDLEKHVRRLPLCADSLECRLRMVQLLGLPPDCDYDRILFFYAERDRLFRPTPDPEIDDSEASLDFPPDTPEHYRKWFAENEAFSYRSATPYPWTRLGYTYDWHQGATTVQGPGEFIVHPGARVKVKRKTTIWTWYQQLQIK